VPLIQFRLDTPTRRGLGDRVRAEYGPDARIVSTEDVLIGGFRGFFAKRVIDVVVNVPDEGANAGAHVFAAPRIAGILGLLDDADAQEAAFTASASAPSVGPRVSTETGQFAAVLNGIASGLPVRAVVGPTVIDPTAVDAARLDPTDVDPTLFDQSRLMEEVRQLAAKAAVSSRAVAPPRRAPTVLSEAGDLVAVVGLGDDAVVVARSLARQIGRAQVCDGGAIRAHGVDRIDDRRSALAGRAYGVETGQTMLVSYGLGWGEGDFRAQIHSLRAIAADQVWVVVDASRKAEDSARWVSALRSEIRVDALASTRSAFTLSPSTSIDLGIPQGWSDANR
jgi:hypothetical protein